MGPVEHLVLGCGGKGSTRCGRIGGASARREYLMVKDEVMTSGGFVRAVRAVAAQKRAVPCSS